MLTLSHCLGSGAGGAPRRRGGSVSRRARGPLCAPRHGGDGPSLGPLVGLEVAACSLALKGFDWSGGCMCPPPSAAGASVVLGRRRAVWGRFRGNPGPAPSPHARPFASGQRLSLRGHRPFFKMAARSCTPESGGRGKSSKMAARSCTAGGEGARWRRAAAVCGAALVGVGQDGGAQRRRGGVKAAGALWRRRGRPPPRPCGPC